MDWKWCRKAAVHLGSGGAVYVERDQAQDEAVEP